MTPTRRRRRRRRRRTTTTTTRTTTPTQAWRHSGEARPNRPPKSCARRPQSPTRPGCARASKKEFIHKAGTLRFCVNGARATRGDDEIREEKHAGAGAVLTCETHSGCGPPVICASLSMLCRESENHTSTLAPLRTSSVSLVTLHCEAPDLNSGTTAPTPTDNDLFLFYLKTLSASPESRKPRSNYQLRRQRKPNIYILIFLSVWGRAVNRHRGSCCDLHQQFI